MTIRIQPLEIDVPEADPFRNDLLGRKEIAEVLTNLMGSIEGPCVLAVDAPWGAGKSTFLHMWSQHLRNGGFPVVEFNAWETDFSEDPFIAISAELTNQLQYGSGTSLSKKIEAAKQAAAEIAIRAAPALIRIATGGLLDVSPLVKEIGDAIGEVAKDRLSRYQEMQHSVKGFKDSLADMAFEVAKCSDDRPLIVIIDELDRCRPSYAVELLEVSKHLFSVNRIVFVLSLNRVELAHSVKAIYGRDFAAEGYLRRFFDLDFRLPEPNQNRFIEETLRATQITSYFERSPSQDPSRPQQGEIFRKLLLDLLPSSDLSLRAIAQAIHRLGLVFGSLPDSSHASGNAAAVAVILRTIDESLYRAFVSGEVSDIDVIEKVFRRPEGRASGLDPFVRTVFEQIVAVADVEIACRNQNSPKFVREYESPLMKRYRELTRSPMPGNEVDRLHASEVIGYAETILSRNGSNGVGFLESVLRLELLSTELNVNVNP